MNNLQFRSMKKAVIDAYPTSTWKEKVENMKKDQIAAIYFSLKERGALDKRKKETKRRDIFQLTIEDCFPEVGVIEVNCEKAADADTISKDIRKKLTTVCEQYDNQVNNYDISPEKYTKPDYDYVFGLISEIFEKEMNI